MSDIKYFRLYKGWLKISGGEWPSDDLDGFIDEYRLDENLPLIIAEHAREYYIMKTKELAIEFLEKSIDIIDNNLGEEYKDSFKKNYL